MKYLKTIIGTLALIGAGVWFFWANEKAPLREIKADHKAKVLIIGSGPAGYTAAIYAARANMKPMHIMGMQPGGQLTITSDVENYPGFKEPVQGGWLMAQMRAQAENVGTQMINDQIIKVDFSQRPFLCTGDSGKTYAADSVIIATGAQAKWLNIPSEKAYMGFGVSGCAVCDGFFFKDKKVAVVGGGSAAVQDALLLARFASHVTLIHRRDQLRAEKIAQDRLRANPKITVIWDSVVEGITGSQNPKSVTGVRVKNIKTNQASDIKVDGVFIAIGHSPATEVFKGQLQLDDQGYIKCQKGTVKTSVPGVFAAGDVQDHQYRQAVTAAGQGCMAALDSADFIENSGN